MGGEEERSSCVCMCMYVVEKPLCIGSLAAERRCSGWLSVWALEK